MKSDFVTLFCLITPLWFLHTVSAQLTGSITSPGNPFIVTFDITNPTTNTISILKWNNIFDNETQLPVSFEVKDGSGDDIQIGSTYAMRSGMTNSDLYVLEPQQTFTKIIDLRSTLQSLPSGPSGYHPKVIQISLPPIFQGIAHKGAYNVPSEAAADNSGERLILGNSSAAGLTGMYFLESLLHLVCGLLICGSYSSSQWRTSAFEHCRSSVDSTLIERMLTLKNSIRHHL